MGASLVVVCQDCGNRGLIVRNDVLAANDDLDVPAWEAPQGFRKVQLGWRGGQVHLRCCDCGALATTSAPCSPIHP